ncbi:hypothetical protein ACFE04_021084 [Oxalis oulophora]
MGWIWIDEEEEEGGDVGSTHTDTNTHTHNQMQMQMQSERRVVRSQCKTEEVEPGKFIRKCQKTEELLRDCIGIGIGKPTQVLQSTKEYTEEDVSNQLLQPHHSHQNDTPFDFPGLRTDIDVIHHQLFGTINRFFDATDEIKTNFLDFLFSPPTFYDTQQPSSSQQSITQGIPVQDNPKPPDNTSSQGSIDLAKEV